VTAEVERINSVRTEVTVTDGEGNRSVFRVRTNGTLVVCALDEDDKATTYVKMQPEDLRALLETMRDTMIS